MTENEVVLDTDSVPILQYNYLNFDLIWCLALESHRYKTDIFGRVIVRSTQQDGSHIKDELIF